MFRIHGRIALLFIFAIVLCTQGAHASYVKLIDTAAWIESSRVRLLVQDEDTTHGWKSDVYTSITNLTSTDGVVAFFESNTSGKRLHAVVYDPGDLTYHHWVSDSARSYSILTISSGVVACINDTMGLIQAAAYDAGDRKWHKWASSPIGGVSGFTNNDGVLSCNFNQNRYAWGAAYDMSDKSWHDWMLGPGQLGGVTSPISHNGVIALLYGGKTVAKAYDPGDHGWITWTQSVATDSKLQNSDAMVAFLHGTYVYGLAYDAGDRKWNKWDTNTNSYVSDLFLSEGNVVYLVGETYSTHFMAEAPRAYFVSVKTSRADSLRYQFFDNSVGGISSWLWTFGDGSSSSDRSPMHTYKRAGDFKVTLMVTGAGGSHSKSSTITVPSRVFTLQYKAGSNGTLTGTATQLVKEGASGTMVTAVPNKGYHFVKWSDGSKSNPRQDVYVAANLTVTATFSNKTPATNWELMR